jgi:hypothetical protein
MFQKLKSYVIHFLINREMRLHQRSKRVVNLNSAGSIGVLFAMENEDDYKFINRFVHLPEIANRRFRVIGYVPEKTVPNYYMAKLKMDLITKSDLNIFDIPNKVFVDEFIQEKFDLMIYMSAGDYLPLDYIAGRSHANFKAGRYREKMIKVFDFMIKRPEGMESSAFSQTVVDYLKIINT